MKAYEVHKMKDEELAEEASRLRQKLFDLRSQAVTEQLENPRQIRNTKRDIARLLTEQRERQIKQESVK
jgi:large subunit ribosomal protein L29